VKSHRGLRGIGLDAGPCIVECQSFVSLPLCFETSNTALSMYLFCKSRTHVITLYSGDLYDILCVNGSVLATRKDPG
jgi:hypothetical protein